MKARDDLFTYARGIFDALLALGVRFDERDGLATIDLRACGVVEVFGTESGAYFRFSGKLGELRVILLPAAFFILQRTFAKGPV
jgi:hypothetical protein